MSQQDLTPEEVQSVVTAIDQNGDEEKKQQPPAVSEASAPSPTISRAQFMQLETTISQELSVSPGDIKRMYDIKVNLEVVLGSTKMPLDEVLKLHPGAVVELNRLAGEPVDIMANDRLIARAEIVVIEDNFGVKIIEIIGAPTKLSTN